MQAKYCRIVSCSSWFQILQNCEPLLQNLKLISIFTEVKYTPDKLVRSGCITKHCFVWFTLHPVSYRDLGLYCCMFFLWRKWFQLLDWFFKLIWDRICNWLTHTYLFFWISKLLCDMIWDWMAYTVCITHLSFGEYSFSSPQHFWNFSCEKFLSF